MCQISKFFDSYRLKAFTHPPTHTQTAKARGAAQSEGDCILAVSSLRAHTTCQSPPPIASSDDLMGHRPCTFVLHFLRYTGTDSQVQAGRMTRQVRAGQWNLDPARESVVRQQNWDGEKRLHRYMRCR